MAQSESIEARFTRSAKLFALRAAALNGFQAGHRLGLFGRVLRHFRSSCERADRHKIRDRSLRQFRELSSDPGARRPVLVQTRAQSGERHYLRQLPVSRLRKRSLSQPRSGAGAGKCRPGRSVLSARSGPSAGESLNLPQTAPLIGTAGALSASRGMDALYRAFETLAAQEKDLHLALAGPRRRTDKIPHGERIHDLGNLPLERVPSFLSALNVAVVNNRDSAFGRFNFPQKAREAIACRVPLVAADVGTMKSLLADHPELLFRAHEYEKPGAGALPPVGKPLYRRGESSHRADMAERLENFFLAVRNHAHE